MRGHLAREETPCTLHGSRRDFDWQNQSCLSKLVASLSRRGGTCQKYSNADLLPTAGFYSESHSNESLSC